MNSRSMDQNNPRKVPEYKISPSYKNKPNPTPEGKKKKLTDKDTKRTKWVKFKLCNDGKFRYVKAPEPCHNCNFSDIKELDSSTDEMLACVIEHDIREGKANCPYDVIKRGDKS